MQQLTWPDSLPPLCPGQRVAEYVNALALQHRVTAERTAMDDLADTFTLLSGDTVTSDATIDLLVALTRARVLTASELLGVLHAHLTDSSG